LEFYHPVAAEKRVLNGRQVGISFWQTSGGELILHALVSLAASKR